VLALINQELVALANASANVTRGIAKEKLSAHVTIAAQHRYRTHSASRQGTKLGIGARLFLWPGRPDPTDSVEKLEIAKTANFCQMRIQS
jgi:hypothetical protein